MESIELRSEKQIPTLFHSPEYSVDGGLESYSVTVSGIGMEATVRVETSPYGTAPSDFFDQLAAEWKGWGGEKEWGAIEGEYGLFAKSDATGHIELTVKLQPSFYAPYWCAASVLVVEAGQLDGLASRFRGFFRAASNK